MTPASCSKTESSHFAAALAARTLKTPGSAVVVLHCGYIRINTVVFRLCCVCLLLLHQFHAKLVESSSTILGDSFHTDCNILCVCIQVQSISFLIAFFRQPLGSQTSHSFSNPPLPSLTNSTIPTIYI